MCIMMNGSLMKKKKNGNSKSRDQEMKIKCKVHSKMYIPIHVDI